MEDSQNELNKKYLGVGLKFPLTFESGKTTALVEGMECLEQRVKILISTPQGRRVLRSQYGHILEELYDEQNDDVLGTRVRDCFINLITIYEPALVIDRGKTSTIRPTPESLSLKMVTSIPSININKDFDFPIR